MLHTVDISLSGPKQILVKNYIILTRFCDNSSNKTIYQDLFVM